MGPTLREWEGKEGVEWRLEERRKRELKAPLTVPPLTVLFQTNYW